MTFADNTFWSSSNSKGDQTKLYQDGLLIKKDTHYEGLIESIVTQILNSLNTPVEYVHYTPCQIFDEYGISFTGCQCENILQGDQTDISLYKLLTYYSNNQVLVAKLNDSTTSTETRVEGILTAMDSFEIVGLGKHLLWLLSIDALVCNKDRHLRNIRFITGDFHKFEPFPMFDFGDSLLQHYYDTMLKNPFPLSKVETILYNTKSKPFSTNFKSQVRAIENVTGERVEFPNVLTIHTEPLLKVYSHQVVELALNILKVQAKRYDIEIQID